MKSSEKLLRELIALPSVNPSFLPPEDSRGGEHRVADFLLAVAARTGLDVETQPVFPGRSNVLARLRPPGKVRQRIVLAPHMDTVGDFSMSPELFQPKTRNGRLYGRGACDTKGCIAAMLTALTIIAESGKRPAQTEIAFVGLVDEEHGQFGSRALAGSGFKADLAIVGEPTQLKLVTAHKGDLWLNLETRGKSAHGARPELGRNAVHAMAQIVDVLERDYARQLRKKKHPLLGHPTINVGSIAGGTQPNIVPARCEISIDRRTLPGENEASVRREIQALLQGRGLTARIANTKAAPCLPLETSSELPLVRQFMKTLRQRTALGVDFFCDAAILARGGIPSVVFGPGDIAQAHTADEWISLDSLERGTRLLTVFLQSLP
jgi:acetylornithine deacetylase/succinyl-diaminopimelate desuccinylase family protein